MNVDDFIDWLNTVERVFNFHDPSKHKKVNLMAIKLRRHTPFWWANLKKQKGREGRSKIVIWGKMKKKLIRRYLPDNYQQDSFLKIHNFKQKELSMEEYIVEFDNLMLFRDLVEHKEQTIVRYLGSLRYEIANAVQLEPYLSFNDACKLALKVERQLVEAKSRPRGTYE